MAEVGIGGTFPEPMSGMRTDVVDRQALEEDRVAAPAEPGAADSRRLAILGRPVPGLEVRIVDPATGRIVEDRHVGELQIRGTSVTPGYYRNERATRELLRDGWLCTGDLAYLVDGEMVMCGRIKDVIIVGGRSVFPEDIERTVADVDGVRAGNVCAFGIEGRKGRETVVVVAEARGNDLDLVAKHIHHRVLEVTGVPAKDVFLAAPSTLPKTSSGKLQRSLCRERFLAGELQPA